MTSAFQNCSKFEDRTKFGKLGNPNEYQALKALKQNLMLQGAGWGARFVGPQV